VQRQRYLIDVNTRWHIGWWATVLAVSEDALLDAITLVGNQSDAVEAYLSTPRRASSGIDRRRVRRAHSVDRRLAT
jgi:hypothetical protein